MLLGISKPVIKAHGSSNATAIRAAIRQAAKAVDGGVAARLQAYYSTD
jgi:glycerol-3-phosphate acyltransferase PlsX